MTDEIDTSAETVERLADYLNTPGQGLVLYDAAATLRALVAARDDERQRAERLEAREAKLRVLLQRWQSIATHCNIEEGVCCCGEDMEHHTEPMLCGHSPVDHGQYIAELTLEDTLAALRQDKGGE